jgi:hypothetical protein
MDNSNSSSNRIGASTPSLGGKGGLERASSSIRYVGAKEPTVPLPLVLIVLALLVLAIVAVRHYVQA